MTPHEFLARLTAYADALQHQEAVGFARRYYPGVAPGLTPEQRQTVSAIMHVAVMATAMERSSPAPAAPEVPSDTPATPVQVTAS
jgi:hypothetical protein